MKNGFCIQHYRIESKKLNKDKELKLVFLSDLHSKQYGEKNERLLCAIRSEAPDYILVGGDMLIGVKRTKLDVAVELAKNLVDIAPVYYANGNHEQRLKLYPEVYGTTYEEYKYALVQCGVHLLENDFVRLDTQAGEVHLYGLEIPAACYAKLRRTSLTTEQIEECVGLTDKGACTILMAHNPKFAEAYVAWGADIVLSGHLHGGVMRIPGLGGVISPQGVLFPKYSGEHTKVEQADVVVSKGLGAHTIPIRIMNPAELVVLDIKGN